MNTIENIFRYNLNDLEYETLDPVYNEETSYLLFTPTLEILNDLHLLFLIRMDRMNSERIINKIRTFEKVRKVESVN